MAPGLVGPDGSPISSQDYKKATPPKLGEAFGSQWSDADFSYLQLPGGGILQFDLSRLTLADFRLMRDHYQVNASLAVLTFMMHQLDWKIESDSERVRSHCQANMEAIWTRLVRALGQAFWSGYSPNILQWENDIAGKSIQLTKVKDLIPEECSVNWKLVEGWAPNGKQKPKIKIFDGIKVIGMGWPIPTENTLWYPLLMENGDHYGKKLLRPAFTSWFFSIIMHLFANRFFERYGEPLPVGRAPYDEELDVNGKKVPGTSVMLGLMQSLRNRSVVVLPSERSVVGNEVKYDYTLEYLESQMRGADFERYLMRLDEEISLSLFTPLLMLRTADVGSYNLGKQHSDVYLQMLNALAGDWAQYINDYVLTRMVDFNFSPTSPRATIKFRKLGDSKAELVKLLLQALVSQGSVMPDLKELGDIAGLTLDEIKEVTSADTEPPTKDASSDDSTSGSGDDQTTGSSSSSRTTAAAIYGRIESQVYKAYREGTFGRGFIPDPGYVRQLETVLRAEGASVASAAGAHARVTAWLEDLVSAGTDAFPTVDDALVVIKQGVINIVKGAINADAH